MKKVEPVRLYNFSDANLITIGREKVAFMQRDAVAFTPFGITPALVTDFNDAITAFSNSLTDVEALSDQTGVTTVKDAKRDELSVAIRNVMARVELRFGLNTANYRKFGTDALAHQTDSELLITGKRVTRVGTSLLSELESNGVTTAMLTQITTLSNELETLIIDMKVRIGDRDILQEDRVEEGNAIYSTLVLYAGTGMTIWETTDVAKYNDYIIYNTFTGEPPLSPAI